METEIEQNVKSTGKRKVRKKIKENIQAEQLVVTTVKMAAERERAEKSASTLNRQNSNLIPSNRANRNNSPIDLNDSDDSDDYMVTPDDRNRRSDVGSRSGSNAKGKETVLDLVTDSDEEVNTANNSEHKLEDEESDSVNILNQMDDIREDSMFYHEDDDVQFCDPRPPSKIFSSSSSSTSSQYADQPLLSQLSSESSFQRSSAQMSSPKSHQTQSRESSPPTAFKTNVSIDNDKNNSRSRNIDYSTDIDSISASNRNSRNFNYNKISTGTDHISLVDDDDNDNNSSSSSSSSERSNGQNDYNSYSQNGSNSSSRNSSNDSGSNSITCNTTGKLDSDNSILFPLFCPQIPRGPAFIQNPPITIGL